MKTQNISFSFSYYLIEYLLFLYIIPMISAMSIAITSFILFVCVCSNQKVALTFARQM